VRQLLPVPAEDVDLRSLYAFPTDRPWVRANMVASVDGSAVREGRSEGLSGAADKKVFGVLRGLCDAVLVGAGTARVEGYRGLKARATYADVRAELGQAPAPRLVVVSRRLELDPTSELFAGDLRTVVVTHRSSNEGMRQRLSEVADVVVAGEDAVDLPAALDELTGLDLSRILCEGGPNLLADLAGSGRLDELCLTLSPLVVGGTGSRILSGPGIDIDVPLRLAHLLEDDGVLLGRWVSD
jgi:riboflavin biosynthesis pyrimidine reductase